jgi:hypothetical protein
VGVNGALQLKFLVWGLFFWFRLLLLLLLLLLLVQHVCIGWYEICDRCAAEAKVKKSQREARVLPLREKLQRRC